MNFATTAKRFGSAGIAFGLAAFTAVTVAAGEPAQYDPSADPGAPAGALWTKTNPTADDCAVLREAVSNNQLAPEAVFDPQAPCEALGINRAAGAYFCDCMSVDETPGPDEMGSSLVSAELDYANGQVTAVVAVAGRTAWVGVSRRGWLPYFTGRQHFVGSGR
jgi:hypothetical protein